MKTTEEIKHIWVNILGNDLSGERMFLTFMEGYRTAEAEKAKREAGE